MNTTPLPYQLKAVRKALHFDGRILLADEMGLGKSFESLLIARELNAWPAVVLCPAYLKYNWEHEALTHLNLRSVVLEGRKIPRDFAIRRKLVILNYDILGAWLKFLRAMRPRLIIIDECHKIGNPNTKQTKNTKRLCKRRRHVVALSGTALVNRPAELFPTLSILRPDRYNHFKTFADRYCKPELKPWGWQYKGADNLDELNRELNRTCMIRRLKSEVMKDLPKRRRIVTLLEIENRREYTEAVRDFAGWITKRKTASLAKKALSAQRLVKMGYLKRLVAELKLPGVKEWIENYLAENEGKLVVFGQHRSILTQLHESWKKDSVLVTGLVKGRKRQEAFDQFNNDKKTRLFLGGVRSAGTGWSCRGTSITATIELGWTPGEHKQADDRPHGLKRGVEGKRVMNYYLVARETIEEDLCRLLQKKQKVLDQTLDGVESTDDSLDIFDQLQKLLVRSVSH